MSLCCSFFVGIVQLFLINPSTTNCFIIMYSYFYLCRFAVATAEELTANDDDCAICWDTMLTARRLPCGHLFHK